MARKAFSVSEMEVIQGFVGIIVLYFRCFGVSRGFLRSVVHLVRPLVEEQFAPVWEPKGK